MVGQPYATSCHDVAVVRSRHLTKFNSQGEERHSENLSISSPNREVQIVIYG